MPMPIIVDNNTNSSTSDSDNANANNERRVAITNPNVEVTLPVLQYGYRATKATWEELVEIIEIEGNIPKLSRSRAQQHDYEVFRYHMTQKYRSTLDYILISKFGFDALPEKGDNNTKHQTKWRAEPCLNDVTTPRSILVENDFPYCVQDNIVHYVLWKLKEPITPHEILEARETLQSPSIENMIRAKEILQWVNPPNLKSIPEIDHVHFLCLL